MAVSLNEIPTGTRISFDVYPAMVYGSAFRNVVFNGTFSAKVAMQLNIDIAAIHSNVYSSLPSTVPDDPTGYDYFSVTLQTGDDVVLGIPFMNANSLSITDGRKVTVYLDDVSNSDMERLNKALSSNGFTPTSIVRGN